MIWLRKAADRGNADAQYRLGLIYQSGQGVAKDPVQARQWYFKAGEPACRKPPITSRFSTLRERAGPKI